MNSEERRIMRKDLILIFTVALLASVSVFLFTVYKFGFGGYSWGGQDFMEYDILARNMIDGNGYSLREAPPYVPTALRTPGYPAMLAFSRLLTGSNLLALFLNAVALAAMGIAAYLISFHLFGGRTLSLVVGLFTAVEPDSVLITLSLMSDVTAAALFILSVYFLVRAHMLFGLTEDGFRRGRLFFILSVASIAASSFIRPVTLAFLAVHAVVFLYHAWRRLFKPEILFAAAASVLLVVAPFGAWMWRNYAVFGKFSLSSAGGGVQHFLAVLPGVAARAENISKTEARSRAFSDLREARGIVLSDYDNVFYRQGADELTWFASIEDFSHDEWVEEYAKDKFRKYPGAYAKSIFLAGIDFFTEANWSNYLQQYGFIGAGAAPSYGWQEILFSTDIGRWSAAVKERFSCGVSCVMNFSMALSGRIIWFFAALGAAAGGIIFFKDRGINRGTKMAGAILFAAIVYFAVLHIYFSGPSMQPRYRMPVGPFLLMFALYGIARLRALRPQTVQM